MPLRWNAFSQQLTLTETSHLYLIVIQSAVFVSTKAVTLVMKIGSTMELL